MAAARAFRLVPGSDSFIRVRTYVYHLGFVGLVGQCCTYYYWSW